MNKIQCTEDFEFMTLKAKAKVLSQISLERPLTDAEFKEFESLMKNIGGEL